MKLKDLTITHKVFAVFILPGEKFAIEPKANDKKSIFSLETTAGKLDQFSENKWNWQAPLEKGLYSIKITESNFKHSMTIHIFVIVPYKELKGEYLNGYRIGQYTKVPFKQLPIYQRPSGFIEVTKENEEILVSPHFKLKQFLCKQQSSYPKYIVIREKLLQKLELVLEKVNEKGYRCDTFVILSGYRTPFYNQAIDNVKYSRHGWGCAADIFIDENPKDDMMDDLNKDGKINWQDAAVLYDIIDELYKQPFYEPFIGGLGRYKKTANHGPFVHIDVRGSRARW